MPRDAPTSDDAAPAAGVVRHQRAEGAFALHLGPAPGLRGAALRRLDQRAPLRVLFPDPEPGDPRLAAVLNCAGGLAGGDALGQAVRLDAGARATLSTAAAEKVYRSLGPATCVATRLDLGPGAALEWIPQETILFDGARLERRLHAALAVDATLLAAETLVLGRAARGERLGVGTALLDRWRLEGPDGAPLWVDAVELGGAVEAAITAPFGFADAQALGTLLLAAPGAEAHLPLLRALPQPAPGGATVPRPGLLLARWLGGAAAVGRAVGEAIVALRAAALGLPPRLPRLWTT